MFPMDNIRAFLKKMYFILEGWLLKFKTRKDILFVIENELMFKYAYEVYQQLSGDKRVRLWFCVVYPERFNDVSEMKKRFKAGIVPYGLARRIKWDLILYPNHGPYFRNDCPKIYIGHGLGSGKVGRIKDHYVFGKYSLNGNGRVIYKKIFLAGEHVKEQVRKHYPVFYPHVKVVGSLLGDRLVNADIQNSVRSTAPNLDRGKKTVMLASSWGPHSLIQSQKNKIARGVRNLAGEYNVVISLHPNNFNKIHFEGVDLAQLFSEMEHENVHIQKPGDDGHLLLPFADVLVTDMTSLGLYFPLLNKPIIFYDSPGQEYFPDSLNQELRKASHVTRDVSDLRSDVREALKNFDKEKMEGLAERTFSYRGRARERYSYEIYESLGLKQKL